MSRLEAQEPARRPEGALRTVLALLLGLAVVLAAVLWVLYRVLAP